MMKCPNCSSSHTVVRDTRPIKAGTRRRRECLDCSVRWSTIEIKDTTYKDLMRKRGRPIKTRPSRIPDEFREEYFRLIRNKGIPTKEARRMLGIER